MTWDGNTTTRPKLLVEALVGAQHISVEDLVTSLAHPTPPKIMEPAAARSRRIRFEVGALSSV
jgi:hypothetical protein